MMFDRWEGEDEEEVKDNWDDEDEEEQPPVPQPVIEKPKKEKLKHKIAKHEEEERRKREAKLANRKLTPEEEMAEKLERKRLQEESDLQVAMETFGVTEKAVTGLDSAELKSKVNFDEFKDLLVKKLLPCQSHSAYPGFLEELFRELSSTLSVDDVKRVSSSLTAMYNEKLKAQKSVNNKKKKGKGYSIKMDKSSAFDDLNDRDDLHDDYDDFM